MPLHVRHGVNIGLIVASNFIIGIRLVKMSLTFNILSANAVEAGLPDIPEIDEKKIQIAMAKLDRRC